MCSFFIRISPLQKLLYISFKTIMSKRYKDNCLLKKNINGYIAKIISSVLFLLLFRMTYPHRYIVAIKKTNILSYSSVCIIFYYLLQPVYYFIFTRLKPIISCLCNLKPLLLMYQIILYFFYKLFFISI